MAGTIEEAARLIESGFEYVTEMDGVKLFRRKMVSISCSEASVKEVILR